MNTKKIYKYELPVQDDVQIHMPEFAKILSVGHQGDPTTLVLWAEVEPENATVPRFFQVRGTGKPLGNLIEVDGRFVGTVNFFGLGVPLVWHVYEVKP